MELGFSFTNMLGPVGDARARGSLEPGSTAFCSTSYHAARSLGKPKAKAKGKEPPRHRLPQTLWQALCAPVHRPVVGSVHPCPQAYDRACEPPAQALSVQGLCRALTGPATGPVDPHHRPCHRPCRPLSWALSAGPVDPCHRSWALSTPS